MQSLMVGGLATLAVASAIRFLVHKISTSSVSKAKNLDSRIVETNTVLLVLSEVKDKGLEDLVKNFCGTVITNSHTVPRLIGKTVFACGDLTKADGLALKAAERVFAIRELSHGYTNSTHIDEHGYTNEHGYTDNMVWPLVDLGRVPIMVHGVGVFYRRFFEPGVDHFNEISSEHAFQTLTESTKPGTAHRTGIYLTPVEKDGEDLHFRLLRCSTNLSGPTANFGAQDRQIIDALNEEAACIFENQAPLNHVLAQIYLNTPAVGTQKQTKAKIKAHADKTKDMPRNGLMAFCTFYDQLHKLQPLAADPFDLGYRNTSGLTQLQFRLKQEVKEQPGCTLAHQFSITLYPDSVFFMPLSTNRLYTHEIRPAVLDARMLPTRMGYVVRCSNAEAVFRQGQTLLKMSDGKLKRLEPPTPEGMKELRKLYADENFSAGVIKYGPTLFSMNQGDYSKPLLENDFNKFSTFSLTPGTNLFHELLASVRFENVGKGRLGTVLVRPDDIRGTPIVRTTTQYAAAAHVFQPVHARLAEQIEAHASLAAGFNNALIEAYTNAYATMGFHSDQAQDLEEGTAIALFSCYRHPELTTAMPPRKLVIESKDGCGTIELPLAHNSVVVWTLDTNRRFKHKIVLDAAACPPENEWLGVTLRTSKTFVQVRDGGEAVLEDGTLLTLADEGQRKALYKMRGRENAEMDFTYPSLPYTLSGSDLLPPVRHAA